MERRTLTCDFCRRSESFDLSAGIDFRQNHFFTVDDVDICARCLDTAFAFLREENRAKP